MPRTVSVHCPISVAFSDIAQILTAPKAHQTYRESSQCESMFPEGDSRRAQSQTRVSSIGTVVQ